MNEKLDRKHDEKIRELIAEHILGIAMQLSQDIVEKSSFLANDIIDNSKILSIDCNRNSNILSDAIISKALKKAGKNAPS